MLLVKFIIKTGNHLFECVVKARFSQKSRRRGTNGGGFIIDIKILTDRVLVEGDIIRNKEFVGILECFEILFVDQKCFECRCDM